MAEIRASPIVNPSYKRIADVLAGLQGPMGQVIPFTDANPFKLLMPAAATFENLAYGNAPLAMPPGVTNRRLPIVKTGREGEFTDLASLGLLATGVPQVARGTMQGANYLGDVLTQAIRTAPPAAPMRALTEVGQMSPSQGVLEETAIPIRNAMAPKGEATKITREGGPIQSAVVLIGDKIFTGQTHGQALNRAIYEGAVKKEGGKYIYPKDAEVNMDLFMTKDGRIIDRLDAYKEFDIGAAETAIEKGLMQVKPASSMTVDQYIAEAEKIKSLRSPESQSSVQGLNVVRPGDVVSGLTVRKEVPNRSSIAASFDDYEILSGIREVPRNAFDPEYLGSLSYDKLDQRTKDLAEQIRQSKEINPLIVGVDSKGAYIVEGGHRFDALMSQDFKSIPALVVIDKSDPPFDLDNLFTK